MDVGIDLNIISAPMPRGAFDSGVYTLDCGSLTWRRSEAPSAARYCHAACVDDNGTVFVFGGIDANGSLLQDVVTLPAGGSGMT